MNKNESVMQFLASYSDELQAKVNRLDKIIGRDHWLSVGEYKEQLLRSAIRKIIPQKYSVSSGFIIGNNGDLIKSKQIDIIIWDSTNYSPLFIEDDFVIITPESCKLVIEIKGKLKKEGLKKTLNDFDTISKFNSIELSNGFRIKKYLFAYDIDKSLSFHTGVLDSIRNIYIESEIIKIEERQDLINKMFNIDTFSIDGVFILSKGFVLKNVKYSKPAVLEFTAYKNTGSQNLIYPYFEYELQRNLGETSQGREGLYYMDQPGLVSLKSVFDISKVDENPSITIPDGV